MTKEKKALIKIILTALFAALCFIGVLIRIPLPTGAFVHLGNMICILAALLLGGIYGGVAGSLGMGLFDLTHGYLGAGLLRTFILKFLMGLVAGLVFKLILKKKLNVKKLTIIFVILLGLAFIASVTLSVISYNNGFVITYTKNGEEVTKTVIIKWIIPLFIGVMFTLGLIDLFLEKKLGKVAGAALIAATCRVVLNTLGEVYLKALLYYWINTSYASFNDAYLYAVAELPATIITSVLTVSIIGFIYWPIHKATKDFNPIDYASQFLDEEKDEETIDDEETTIDNEKDAEI
ncbi:MAG: ECF transporter S component [bacterium]|nr:ECF transporter S component [bacterium]